MGPFYVSTAKDSPSPLFSVLSSEYTNPMTPLVGYMSFASSIGSGSFAYTPSLIGSGYGSATTLALSSFIGSALTSFVSLRGSSFGYTIASSSIYLQTFVTSGLGWSRGSI